MIEMQRLRERGANPSGGTGGGPRGRVTITDLRVPLKADFVAKLGTPQGREFIFVSSADFVAISLNALLRHDFISLNAILNHILKVISDMINTKTSYSCLLEIFALCCLFAKVTFVFIIDSVTLRCVVSLYA